MPLVTDIFKAELKAAGKKVNNNLCEHFAYTRQELFQIVKIKEIKTFDELLASHGNGTRLRDLQAGGRVDPGQPVERGHPRRSTRRSRTPTTASWPTSSAAGLYSRRAARPRRRDHAREAHRPRAGRQEVRPLHQDHRRPARRPVRRPGPAASRHLGGAGRRRLRERPRLRQGAAHREELRRHDLVPLRRAGLGRVRDPRREALQAASARRTRSRRPSPAASASAPRPRARTSA